MHELSIKSADTTLDINSAVETTRVEVEKIIDEISNSVALLNQVSVGVTESFSGIESEVSMIDSIAQTSLAEADSLKEKFQSINTEVLTQLEAITRLLADTIGEITGVKVENVNVNDDFFKMKIIDVRRPDEFNAELGHIPEAELMCLQDNFEQQIKKINKEEPHLFVCRSSGQSARAARIALGMGFKYIFNMNGGMLEYCKVIGTPDNASTPPVLDMTNDDVLF